MLKVNKLCPCGSGNKLKKCCLKKHLWTLKSGPQGTHKIYINAISGRSALLVFSSQEKAEAYIRDYEFDKDEAVGLGWLSFNYLANKLVPGMKRDGIGGIILDLRADQKGVLFHSFNKRPPPLSDCKTMSFPREQEDAKEEDLSWFKDNPDLEYRIRPPTELERNAPECPDNFIILVVKLTSGIFFRMGLDRDKHDLDDFDWEEIVLQIHRDTNPDECTKKWMRVIHECL